MNKKLLLFIFTLISIIGHAQIQIGNDIDGVAASNFAGIGVSLSNDGNTVAVSATGNDTNGNFSGQVRIFENNSGSWVQKGAEINGENANDYFGVSIDLSANGNIIAIGASFNDDNGAESGHVRIFEYIGNIWTQIGNSIAGESDSDFSGEAIALSSDGNIVAIGAVENDDNGQLTGHVRVFENISGIWTQIGNDIDGEDPFDFFGNSMALSSNGNILAVGARSGEVKIYENTAGVWVQLGSTLFGEASQDLFGISVSLSADGTVLAVGAERNDSTANNAGHARVFNFVNSDWTQIGADIDGEAADDEFGYRVDLSDDGTILAVGSRFNDGNGTNSGEVKIFQNQSNSWVQIGTDVNGEAAEDFAGYVALSGDGTTLVVGATGNDGAGNSAGHARIFDISQFTLSTTDFDTADFKLYPNPVESTLYFSMSHDVESIEIISTLGQKVMRINASNKIDVSKLNSGVYELQVQYINGTTEIKKFLKN